MPTLFRQLCLKAYLILVMTALASVNSFGSKTDFSKPDFAYPKTVATNSRERLETALNNHNEPAALRAMIDYVLARNLVSSDSTEASLNLAINVTSRLTSPEAKALAYMWLAQSFSQIYESNRWNYDRRELPDEPASEDFSQWSGVQFRKQIESLIDSATMNRQALIGAPLSRFKGVVTIPSATEASYPTVYDFIMLRATTLCEQISNEMQQLPAAFLCDAPQFDTLGFSYQSGSTRRQLELFHDWLSAQKSGTAPLVAADMARLEFVCNHLNHQTENSDSLRFNTFINVYNANRHLTVAGDALVNAANYINYDNIADASRLLSLIDEFTPKHSGSNQAKQLTNIRNSIIQPRLNTTFCQTVAPGDTLKVAVRGYNSSHYQLRLYRIEPSTDNSYYYMQRNSEKAPVLVRTLNGRSNGGKMPYAFTDTLDIPFDRCGWYVIVPATSPGEPSDFKNRSYQVIYCTNLMLATASYAPQKWAMVVNPRTGKPVAGATVEQRSNKGVILNTYTTDADGSTALKNVSGTLRARSGNDSFAAPVYTSQPYVPLKGTQYAIHAFTDLALYRLSDTVRWCAVAEAYNPSHNSALANCQVTAILRDANYQPVDTATAVTDRFGRAEGSFVLPSWGLTGNFTLQFTAQPTAKITTRGNVAFMVSDYKLPTFRVDSLKASLDIPAKGAVQVSGLIINNAGFPLDGCRVGLSLNVATRPRGWWWNSGSGTTFYTTEVTAGPNGRFSIDLPETLLAQSPVTNGLFTANITATSASGETQLATTIFTLGKPCFIRAELPENINISNGKLPIAVSLTECNGDVRKGRLNVTLTDSRQKTVLSTQIDSDKKTDIDVAHISSGTYTLEIAPVDNSLADPLRISNRVLYRDNDIQCPAVGIQLWTPESTLRLTNGQRTATIRLGSCADTSAVHYAIVSDSTLIKQGWCETGRTMSGLPVTLPEGTDRVTVKLWSVNNYNQGYSNVTVVAEPQPSIRMSIESFRDHITPGQEEKWTFRITDSEGKGRQAAVMLDMYNRALEQLRSYSFGFTPSVAPIVSYNFSGGNSLGEISTQVSKSFRYISTSQPQLPQYQDWGLSLASNYIKNMVLVRSVETSAGGTMMMKAEAKTYMAAAADEAVLEEAAVEMDMGSAYDEESENGAANFESQIAENDLRQSEMPLAFFRPMLTTNNNGELEFSFTAPNANTTWRLYAQAFTADMLTTTDRRDIVSAKPIMVQPNLPRFMRNGDVVKLKALVMNNTDSTATATTIIEIFNPLNRRILKTYSQTDTIAANNSTTVSVDVTAPAELATLGYRVQSRQGLFADGEQSIIPILAASSPVIESTPFYISPGQKQFSMQLPDNGKDVRTTLQFCQNPTWYVATALPGLRNEEATDALSAAASLFSAATARGLLNSNPAIAEALKMWSESDRSDSTMISMLQRNADLKTVLLESTPWVMDAQSDTERMARLAMLFDSTTVETNISKAVDMLAKLECAGGGWRWIEQSAQPSEWITENILFMLGRLSSTGYTPTDNRLSKMTANAVAYLDSEVGKQLKQNPELTDPAFTYLRQIYYPQFALGQQLANLTSRTVKKMSTGWETAPAPYKAMTAILLSHNGYKTQAGQIMKSLEEYAVSSDTKGMWWPSVEESSAIWWTPSAVARTCIVLDAYNRLQPDSEAIDKIRQWIILQKEAQNWGNSVATTQAVATLLTSGSNWTLPQEPATIKIGRKKLNVSPTDTRLGYIRTDISDLSPAGKKLSIELHSDTPAWGAVYQQFTSPMQSVAPSSCDDLKIEKHFYRQVNSPDGSAWVETDTFSVGDIVQINLTVVAARQMDYVAITDERAACFEPTQQLPQPIWSEGICFYRENRDSSTNMFVTRLPKGTYRLSYTLKANNAGNFASGIATVQSQYAPQLSAHSGGNTLTIK